MDSAMDINIHSMFDHEHRIFILTGIELVMSSIISISCLLIHFRQHFRLQCINRHYTKPDMPNVVLRISGKFSGIDHEPNETKTSAFPPKQRSSIFSKDTLIHPKDAIQWCLRSIDDQEFDFFPRSFVWYLLFLVCLQSVIIYKFITNPIHNNHLIEMYSDVIDIEKHSIFHRSSFLLLQESSIIDWIIIYGVLILTNWESLFVFYRYYSTTYTAKYFNVINNSIIFKVFSIYALLFISLFVAQIHFYYYIFPFIILFMSLFVLFCCYKTSQILIQQFKQMDIMMESFGSNRDVQNAMRASVYFMRTSSMISSICSILYLSLLLITHNIYIIYYLPILWTMVSILLTLNFIRNRIFLGRICCCCISGSHPAQVTSQVTADTGIPVTDFCDHGTGTTVEVEYMTDGSTHCSNPFDDNRDTMIDIKHIDYKVSVDTNTVTTIHHEMDHENGTIMVRNFTLDALCDTDNEGVLSEEDEEHELDEQHFDENGTIRFYPMAHSRDVTPKDLKITPIEEHSFEDSQSLEQHSSVESPIKSENYIVAVRNVDSNQKHQIIEMQNQWKQHKWIGKKAKSHGHKDTKDITATLEKSYSTRPKERQRVRFKVNPNHLMPRSETQHRRIQSERASTELAQIDSNPPTTFDRSPSVSHNVDIVDPNDLPQITVNHSDPVKKKTILQAKDTNHQPSHSFHTGDQVIINKNRNKGRGRSRRTLSRRLVFRNLPKQVQKLSDIEKKKVEEFANLSHMMTLHGFCEKNQLFQFEICETEIEHAIDAIN